MQVTKTTVTPKAVTTPKTVAPKKAKKTEDAFDTAATAKTKKASKTAKTKATTAEARRTRATATLLEKGSKKVTSETHTDTSQTRVMLGSLSVSIVLSVMHALEQPAPRPLDGAADQMASLAGALFIEFLATHVDPDALSAVDHALGAADQFSDRFSNSFGFSPLEGLQRFLGFIGLTEGQPQQRLAGTRYAT